MTEPFIYSSDLDPKSRIESFEAAHPDFMLEGLSDFQVEHLLAESEALLAAQGIVIPDEDDDIDMPDEKPSKAPVSVAKDKPAHSLTPAAARALLVANGVAVGARGRLSADQWEKAYSLS